MIGSHKFYIIFIEAFSYMNWMYLLTHKSETFVKFMIFQKIIEMNKEMKIKNL